MKPTEQQRAVLKAALEGVGIDLAELERMGEQRSKQLDAHAIYKGLGELVEDMAEAGAIEEIADGEMPEEELDVKAYMKRMDKTMSDIGETLKQLLGNRTATPPTEAGKAAQFVQPVTQSPADPQQPHSYPAPAQFTPEQLMSAFEALKMGNGAPPPAQPSQLNPNQMPPANAPMDQNQILDEVWKRMNALEQAKQQRYGGSVRDMIAGIANQYVMDTNKEANQPPPGTFDPATFTAHLTGISANQ